MNYLKKKKLISEKKNIIIIQTSRIITLIIEQAQSLVEGLGENKS